MQGASLNELQSMLKDLRQLRIIRKQAGKKAFSQTGVRVELPVGADKSSADQLLKKLGVSDVSTVEYTENSKLTAGVRIFV